ncbi:peptidoglycan editing factor PgeF [Shewanella sp. A14]
MFKHDWPLPDNVAIAMTNRYGGVSVSPFDSLNLGGHVGDVTQQVLANRAILNKRLSLPAEPIWLEQVHGIKVVDARELSTSITTVVADGCYSDQFGHVCAVMTADCLPILLCDQQGTQIAAVHAGWRGLCDGIIEQALARFNCSMSMLNAYLGPAIGPLTFEVGSEVRDAFISKNSQAATYFTCHNTKYLADLVGLAKLRLSIAGVHKIYSADVCTFSDLDYYSYRRDQKTGRMASLIWLKS